jgi:hypothetical protein
VETIRLASLNIAYSNPGLTTTTGDLLRTPRLEKNFTNRSYKRGQSLFIEWALEQDISTTNFTEIHVVNFLSKMFESRGYQHTTLRLFRSAIPHLHHNPDSIRMSQLVHTLLHSITAKAPPKPLHRSTVNLQPTLRAIQQIESGSSSTHLSRIQQKLAFLLGMAAFLRPSDLRRIDFATASVTEENNQRFLSLNVVAPKEKRGGQRIIKPFRVYSHSNPTLCPVTTFIHLRNRVSQLSPPPSVTSLFLNNTDTTQIVQVTTISSWIRRFIQLSTSEPRVNLRSLASSLALRSGISVEDIITLGNWSSSDVFHNHYRREHLSLIDFTNTVLQVPVEDQDTFYNAESHFQ